MLAGLTVFIDRVRDTRDDQTMHVGGNVLYRERFP